MDKSPDAFRTISEVAADLGLPQHVLRFWETKFPQIRPLKRGGGRRYYRPDDVELLRGIRHLLYGEGYTIRGVQRILKAQGVRFVMNVWRDGAPQPSADGVQRSGGRPIPEDDGYDMSDEVGGYSDDGYVDDAYPAEADAAGAALSAGYEPERYGSERPGDTRRGPGDLDHGEARREASAAAMAQRFAPAAGDSIDRVVGHARDPMATPPTRGPSLRAADPHLPTGETSRAPRAAQTAREGLDEGPTRSGFGAIIDRFRGNPSGRPEGETGPVLNPRLSREELRQLQATLFELLECKRLLDQAR